MYVSILSNSWNEHTFGLIGHSPDGRPHVALQCSATARKRVSGGSELHQDSTVVARRRSHASPAAAGARGSKAFRDETAIL